MTAASLTVKPGVVINAYTIKAQIALGGFGTVWRAEHIESRQPAAIKVLHPHLVSAETLVLRFEREANAIARMRHPNIVELYEHGRLPDGRPYLVMEMLQGLDLGAHIGLRGALSPGEVLLVIEQLCGALAVAHAQGIVHRDLKASNVFMSEREGALRVVLFDFGIAKLLGNEGPQITLSSSLLGSPACMSPEQILGNPVDVRTDVYALGSLTYHMLVGNPPFSGASPSAILTRHLEDHPPYPSLHGDVSPAFDSVVTRAMSKEPAQRFAGVDELLAAYRAALGPSSIDDVAAPVRTTLALGLYIDVRAEPDALDEPDDALLDDMEAIVPLVVRQLAGRGYLLAFERSSSGLLVCSLSGTDQQDARARALAIDDARAVFAALRRRPDQDERVHVSLYLHVGYAGSNSHGTIEGGALLAATSWVLGGMDDGIFASAEVLRDLSVPADEQTHSPGLYRLR